MFMKKLVFKSVVYFQLILFFSGYLFLKTAKSQNVDAQIKLHLFELSDVHLLDSPFKQAMLLDGEYLLKLEPNRLLAPYLEEAGLEPKADHYGGWESKGEMGAGLDGHTLGHYLSALSMIYASTGNPTYNKRIKYIVSELKRAQQANGTGYVGGVPNGEKVFKEVRAGKIEAKPFSLNGSWVPWYNLHKLFAGLRDTYRYADNEQALDILIKLSNWAVYFANGLTKKEFQTMLQTEHGGMKEVMCDVYGITGKQKYLTLCKRFSHQAIFQPLAQHKDTLAGLHANTQIPKIVGAARHYEVTGNKRMKSIATFFWHTVVNNRTYANGGNSSHEHFGQLGELSERLSRSTSETCNTYNMLKLTRHLTQWKANPAYADYYERALYNHILASQDPQTGMFCYYMSMESGTHKVFSKPFDSFWCCVGTGMENHTKYGIYIYMHTDDELYINLFIPSKLQWESKGVEIRQETNFPKSNISRFTVSTDQPKKFTMQIRRPYWAGKGFRILVNGKEISINEKPSSYISVQRKWKDGDQVTVILPMEIRIESLGNDNSKVAFMYGPLLLAGIVGEEVPIAGQYASKQYKFFDQPAISVPPLTPKVNDVAQWIKPQENKELEFVLTNKVGEAAGGITLAPYYKVNHAYYTIYWDIENRNKSK